MDLEVELNILLLLLVSLLDTSDSPTTEYDQLSPIGYMCLDIASILNSSGSSPVKIHVEPWVIIDPKVRNTFLGGPTMLQVSGSYINNSLLYIIS